MNLAAKVGHAIAVLRQAELEFAPAVLSTSLGVEDQVLTDLIARHVPGIGIFALDTGRLPAETYELLARTEARYRRRIQVYFPATAAVEQYVRFNGINGFFESVTQRKACCEVRKTEPLRRALDGKRGWITGMRREQSVTRTTLEESSFDETHGVRKFNPLADWTQDDVWAYTREHDVPYNALHDRAYPSIGCAPCTRAVDPGEDLRAGRWWWESAEQKECGLHVAAARPNSPALEPAAT